MTVETKVRLCTVDGCDSPLSARGLCGSHYARRRRYGSPTGCRHLLMQVTVKTCARCGGHGPFYVGYKSPYCKACTRAATRARSDRDREAKRARDRAYYHANRERYAEARRQNFLANKERDYARIAKARYERRAAAHGGSSERYVRAEIFERDNYVCGLCGLSIDRLLVHPHPGFASIDHVLPLARGGDDAPENVQAAHLRCNQRKNAKVI